MAGNGRGGWHSRAGFLLAVIGSAVGLGNIWRFPFIAYKNGGGAFLIPYIIALVTVGIPLMILELGIGHKFKASAPLALSRIGRRWEFLGWWMVTFVFIGIMFYYCVVLSWCTDYLYFSFGLRWGSATETFFEKYLGLSSGPYKFGGISWRIVGSLAVVWFLNWIIVYKGIRRGIEVASKILIPFLAVIIVVLVVWSLTLPGAISGVKAYLEPDFSRLAGFSIWANAFSQVFFSLSLGFGIMVAYASYLPQKANIKTSAIIGSLGDTFFALIAGVAVFATLGYMSHVSGRSIDMVASGGPGLAFVTYPETINHLPFGREFFGGLFFLALIFAGLTSSVSIAESATSSLIDKFGWSRKKVSTALAVIGFAGGLLFATGAGLYWLDVVDYFINHFGLLTVGMFEAIAIGWVYKASKMRLYIDEISLTSATGKGGRVSGAKFRKYLDKWWEYLIVIWIPLVLGVLIVMEFVEQILHPHSGYEWIFIAPVGFGWIVMTLAIAWFLKSRGWRKPLAKESGI